MVSDKCRPEKSGAKAFGGVFGILSLSILMLLIQINHNEPANIAARSERCMCATFIKLS